MGRIGHLVLTAAVGPSGAMGVRAADIPEKPSAIAGGWQWMCQLSSNDGHAACGVTLTGLGERLHPFEVRL